ncbi:hypothetical protein BT63DRAFT_429685 [Microthyrium microscopicum]|uniref:DAPG hydrolase PhiG domain-containing protein n=1 Tax=Microthyrium microscopicum TaxID=703497 RepID=A0A6A6TZQ8_9PEZI|nr:hypothetical protein BT63DRAFT_429685 [Microthyrium microscopicum]
MATNYEPLGQAHPILLRDANLLLSNDYLPFEAGYAVTSDGMHHVAAHTYMKGASGKMIDWWFGFIHTTEQYKWWHPRDHFFSDWDGPRDNNSTYIGGTHLVKEQIGPQTSSLAISFLDPGSYFGANWKEEFKINNYSTAVCGTVNAWDDESGGRMRLGHLIHLVQDTADGCRMRSRFWLGDLEPIDGQPLWTTVEERAKLIDPSLARGLLQHASEEMSILGSQLPELYKKYSKAGAANI